MSYLLLLLAFTSTINGLQNQVENTNDGFDLKPILSIIQRSHDQSTDNQQHIHQVEVKPDQKSTTNQRNNQETRTERKSQLPVVSARQHQILQPQYAPVAFIEPQFQYPGFGYVQGKQPISRVQPQLVFYGPGQGQPILINPGSPPGNFLIPHQPQPTPNFVLRDQGPVFLAGYPKPAHIPPIEKDAEEIPTNPAKIPPLPTASIKPEKLETFNEGKNEIPNKIAGEADLSDEANKNAPAFPQTTNLKPGQRFFVLNGESIFQNYASPEYPGSPSFDPQYILAKLQQSRVPTKQELDIQYNTFPFRPLPLRNEIPKDSQGHFIESSDQSSLTKLSPQKQEKSSVELSQQIPQQIQHQSFQQSHQQLPQEIIQRNLQFPIQYNLQDSIFNVQPQELPIQHSDSLTQDRQLSDKGRAIITEGDVQSQGSQFLSHDHQLIPESRGFPESAFFKTNSPFSFDGVNQDFGQFGQFKFTSPSETFYPIDGDSLENDSIVVNANLEDDSSDSNKENSENEASSQSDKSSDPSTAQAAPGAIALAGPGGVAGAAPKGTALAGKGGLAISSPQATAVAGNQRQTTDKKMTNKAGTK